MKLTPKILMAFGFKKQKDGTYKYEDTEVWIVDFKESGCPKNLFEFYYIMSRKYYWRGWAQRDMGLQWQEDIKSLPKKRQETLLSESVPRKYNCTAPFPKDKGML